MYTFLYNACVTSITDYASEITGYTQFESSLQVQIRAIRAYLGLPKNSVNVGVLSEVDWLLPEYRTQLKMIGQYQRILKMTNCRLTKKVYLWDRALNESGAVTSWNSEIKNVLYSCNQHAIYDNNVPFSLDSVVQSIKQTLRKEQAFYLKSECEEMPKLGTFLSFKQFDQLPAYVTKPLTFSQKKLLAKIRLGSLGIRIESGRYSRPRLDVNQRLCEVCNENFIEDEFHFVYVCGKYKAIRDPWINNLIKPDNFENLDEGSKLGVALNVGENVKSTARFIMDAFNMRSRIING